MIAVESLRGDRFKANTLLCVSYTTSSCRACRRASVNGSGFTRDFGGGALFTSAIVHRCGGERNSLKCENKKFKFNLAIESVKKFL